MRKIILVSFVLTMGSPSFGGPRHEAPISVGSPQNGALLFAKRLKPSDYLNIRQGRNYGTKQLIAVIEDAIQHVHKRHPETPKLYVGDLSDHNGGELGRHASHQSGRDADIAYFRDGPLHNETALVATKADELDIYRTWTLLAFLLKDKRVKMIFSVNPLIQTLHQHALAQGYSKEQLEEWFGKNEGKQWRYGKIRHWDGHNTHFHLRVNGRSEAMTWQAARTTLEPEILAELGHVHTKTAASRVKMTPAPKLELSKQPPLVAVTSSRPLTRKNAPRRRATSARARASERAWHLRNKRRQALGFAPMRMPNVLNQLEHTTSEMHTATEDNGLQREISAPQKLKIEPSS